MANDDDDDRPIGTATMLADGTIVLDLIAESPGARGNAQFRYPPGHPKYQRTLDHLGGLAVGEQKLVPPYKR